MTAALVAGALALGDPSTPAAPAGGAAPAGAGAPDAPLAQVAAELARAGAAVLVLDARDGHALASAGPVDAPRPSGSLFKIVTALAAGEAREPALGERLRCPALPGAPRCAGPGHGDLTLEEALAQSCNAYFGQLGHRVGTAALRRTAARLGLGRAPGRLPDEDARPAEAGAHGAGVLVTAGQVAGLLRAVALGRPPDGEGPLPGLEVLPRVRAGLRASVTHGTSLGAAAPGEPVAVAGKTGTAALGRGTVGWFAGYAPATAPAVVVVVALRRTGREAAQAARPLFEAYFHGRAAAPGGAGGRGAGGGSGGRGAGGDSGAGGSSGAGGRWGGGPHAR